MIAIPAPQCAAQYSRKTYGKFLICGENNDIFGHPQTTTTK